MTARQSSRAALNESSNDEAESGIISSQIPNQLKRLRLLHVEEGGESAEEFRDIVRDCAAFDIEVTSCSTWDSVAEALDRMPYDVLVIELWLENHTTVPIIEKFTDGGGHRPVIMLSRQCADDMASIADLVGATGVLCRAELSSQKLEDMLQRLALEVDSVSGGDDIQPVPANAPRADLASELKDIMLALDAVHAHTTVASGLLGPDETDEVSGLLSHATGAAADARQRLFGLVTELQKEVVETCPVSGRIETTELIENAIELLEHDADSRDIGLIFRKAGREIWIDCDTTAFQHMIETLLASVIWKAEPRTSIRIEAETGPMLDIRVCYRASREIRIVDANSGDAAIHAALSDLNDYARRYGGLVSVEPHSQHMIARLSLPMEALDGGAGHLPDTFASRLSAKP